MKYRGRNTDPDDFFSDTRMSFGDHIEDLRRHLVRAFVGFGLALVIALPLGSYALDIIAAPVQSELQEFYNRRLARMKEDYVRKLEGTPDVNVAKESKGEFSIAQLEKLIGHKVNTDGMEVSEDGAWVSLKRRERPLDNVDMFSEIFSKLGQPPTLRTFTIMETFMVWFKVCLLVGLVLGSPWIFYQIWSFIAAGLYPHEKRLVNLYLPISIVLFLLGVAMCQFVVMPRSVGALLWFNEWLGFEPELRLNDWLSFALILALVFGLGFQTPLVMVFLDQLGIVTADQFRKHWRIVWFMLCVVAIIVLPTPDATTLLMLWIPLVLFYELGIIMCRYLPKPAGLEMGADESEEMIEV
jgi:sec-independent protein translocase protein TatC